MIEDLLVVGRRVRVRLSPECQGLREKEQPFSPHFAQEDGQIGEIVPSDAGYVNAERHPIYVKYSRPMRINSLEDVLASPFAASELIPLDDDGSEILHPMLAAFER